MFDRKAYYKIYNQLPEVKARLKALRERPEAKARVKAYSERPEVKARHAAYDKAYRVEYYKRPEVVERRLLNQRSPEARAYQKAYRERPGMKENTKAYQAEWRTRPGVLLRERHLNKAYRETAKVKARKGLVRKALVYGISPETLVQLLIDQAGLCAMCDEPLGCSPSCPTVFEGTHVCMRCQWRMQVMHNRGWLAKYLAFMANR